MTKKEMLYEIVADFLDAENCDRRAKFESAIVQLACELWEEEEGIEIMWKEQDGEGAIPWRKKK